MSGSMEDRFKAELAAMRKRTGPTSYEEKHAAEVAAKKKKVGPTSYEEKGKSERRNESTVKLIDDILSGNAMEMENTFQSIMADKVSTKLEDFRKEVAQGMFNESTEITDEQILEDIMSLEELSQETINSYVNKAAFDHVRSTTRSMKNPPKSKRSLKQRLLGIIRGTSKLTKEQVETIESALSSEELDENVGGTYKKHQQSDWEGEAKRRGLKVKPTVDSEGESGKSWKAVDNHGNHRGEFHLNKGGNLKS